MSRDKSLDDLIFHSETVCQAVRSELEFACGYRTLIILEGFDEFPNTCHSEPSEWHVAGKTSLWSATATGHCNVAITYQDIGRLHREASSDERLHINSTEQ